MLPIKGSFAALSQTLTLRFSRFRILCSMVTSSCLSGLYGSGTTAAADTAFAFDLAAFPLLLLLAKSVWLPSAVAAALLLLWPLVVATPAPATTAVPGITEPPSEMMEERFSLLTLLLLVLLAEAATVVAIAAVTVAVFAAEGMVRRWILPGWLSTTFSSKWGMIFNSNDCCCCCCFPVQFACLLLSGKKN